VLLADALLSVRIAVVTNLQTSRVMGKNKFVKKEGGAFGVAKKYSLINFGAKR